MHVIKNRIKSCAVQILLLHGVGLRFVLVVEVLLVHQYYVIICYCDFRQPRMIGACQINLPEWQTQPHGNRRYQHIVRTGNTPSFTENPVTETLKAFNRRSVINIEFDMRITGQ